MLVNPLLIAGGTILWPEICLPGSTSGGQAAVCQRSNFSENARVSPNPVLTAEALCIQECLLTSQERAEVERFIRQADGTGGYSAVEDYGPGFRITGSPPFPDPTMTTLAFGDFDSVSVASIPFHCSNLSLMPSVTMA